MNGYASDLVVLAADRDMEAALRGMLARPKALGIRDLRFDLFVYRREWGSKGLEFLAPTRKGLSLLSGAWDPECYKFGHEFLRSRAPQYAHGLIMFDRQDCGQEKRTREELEKIVEERLRRSGWGDRAAAIAIDPELEVWVWSDSPHVDRCLGWQGRKPDLRVWLQREGMWSEDLPKPQNPKDAVKKALRRANKRASSSIYGELAKSVSVERCTDPAFQRFRELLKEWFPVEPSSISTR